MQLFECQHCGQLLYFENTPVRALRTSPGLSAGIVRSKHRRMGEQRVLREVTPRAAVKRRHEGRVPGSGVARWSKPRAKRAHV